MQDPDAELLVRDEGHVRTFTINRPERANALSRALRSRLTEEMIQANEDPNVRVVVIAGAGDRVFCGGADMKEMSGSPAGTPSPPPTQAPWLRMFEAVMECRTPTIAAINGHAVGAGLELAMACDLRIASEAARLGIPEAKRGMGPQFASVVLPRLVPPAIALEMLFTGEPIAASEAARWGLVNRVVPPDQVAATAAALAAQIAANAPLSVRYMKAVGVKGLTMPVPAALRLDFGPNPQSSEDRQEGIRAFAERRPPRWQGR